MSVDFFLGVFLVAIFFAGCGSFEEQSLKFYRKGVYFFEKKEFKNIKESIVDLIIRKIVNKDNVDKNKIAVISEIYGKDLYDLASHLG